MSILLLSSTSFPAAGQLFWTYDTPTVATCPAPNTQSITRSLSSQSCAACCDRYCLLSTRKFVWVLLGPGLVSPRPKQIQPSAAFHSGLFNSECVQCFPASLSQCTFPVPVSCWISKCYRDSSRHSGATQMVSVSMTCTWLQLVQDFCLLFLPFVMSFLSLLSVLLPLSRWA